MLPFQNVYCKCLIDTGSTKSFINPDLAKKLFPNLIRHDPYVVSTALGSSKQNHSVTIPAPAKFKTDKKLKFRLFKFHKYFDCLIGLDCLQQLNAVIDLTNDKLILPNTKIDLMYKILENSINTSAIKPLTDQVIKIKIKNIENGTGVIPSQQTENLEIPECIVNVKSHETFISVTNSSNQAISFRLPEYFEAIPETEFDIEINHPNHPEFSELNNIDLSEFEFDLNKVRLDHLNPEELNKIKNLLNSYVDIFQFDNQPLSFTNSIKHRIRLKDDTPIYSKSYRYPYIHKEEVKNQIQSMLKQGIIRPSHSPWSSPVWIVPKKIDASGKRKWRLVVDYRGLNNQSIDDRYPIPNISDILDKLGKCQYFTTLDLASGFHQIEVDPKDIEKTAFTVDHGHYEFLRMPMGLKNAPSTFQRVMDNVLRDLLDTTCIVYLDDIIIFSTSLQEHIVKLKSVFDRLRKFNFKVQLDKSEFLRKEVNYLGHVITPDGIKPNPDKIDAILKYPVPKTTKHLKGFLGLLGYYRKFIKNFAKITKPLTNCLKKDNIIDINNKTYVDCFKFCKTLLMNEPLLQHPDFEKPFILTTDASNFALGAVLSQGLIGSDLPISYASRTLNEHETNYSTIEKELLAIVWATKYFRPYLYGRKFTIVTDHKPLQWLFSLKEPNSKLVRWRLRLEEFDYDICYKKGKLNSNADSLSRLPNLNILEDDLPIFKIMKQFNHDLACNEDSTNDNDSIIVETPEQPEQDLEDDEENTNDTVHTNLENPICSVSISLEALNISKNQIQFISVKTNPQPVKQIKLFENSKQRFLVQISSNKYDIDFLNFIKEHVVPNTLYSCHFENDRLYEQFTSVVQKHFNNKLKFKKCNKVLLDVESLDEQRNLLENYHTGKSNHRGIQETYQKISARHYWPNMLKDIQRYINSCDICNVVKYDRNPLKLKFNITPTPSKPFEIVHIDVLKYESHKFLTIIDAFSKYAQVYELDTMQAVEITEKLLTFISHHSVPGIIVCDNGPEFSNGLVSEFLTLHKIDVHFCSPHNPASNGVVERFNSTFLDHLNLLNNRPEFNHDNLKTKVLLAIIAYNNSIHSSTKKTPFEILNYDMQQPLDINLEQQLTNNYVQSHKEKVKALYQIINENLNNHKTNIISKLNENREDVPQNLPEKVFVKSNFRSKRRNRYKKEKVLKASSKEKTFEPEVDNSKTGRKFKKLHMANIKRPHKNSDFPIAGTSCSSAQP